MKKYKLRQYPQVRNPTNTYFSKARSKRERKMKIKKNK